MSKEKFSKQALSPSELINFLLNQGLVLKSRAQAQRILSVVGYYRLSGYFLKFKSKHNGNKPRVFYHGTTFEQVWSIYKFDQELRVLVSDAVEKIEVAFRSAIVNSLSLELGPFWYVENKYFKDNDRFAKMMQTIKKILNVKQEVFLKHYYKKYFSPTYPPIWMVIETLPFGVCSKLFTNLKSVAHKKAICRLFNQSPTIIDSWMRFLVYIRNLCAHHARLWNRWLVNAPLIPKKNVYKSEILDKNRSFIAISFVICTLLKEIAPNFFWKERLYILFEKYDVVSKNDMGFLNGWRDDPFWKM